MTTTIGIVTRATCTYGTGVRWLGRIMLGVYGTGMLMHFRERYRKSADWSQFSTEREFEVYNHIRHVGRSRKDSSFWRPDQQGPAMFGNFFKSDPRKQSALLTSVRAAIEEQQKRVIPHENFSDFQEALELLWGMKNDHHQAENGVDAAFSGLLDLTPESDDTSLGALSDSVESGSPEEEAHWSIGMSNVFVSAVSKMDRKLKGRILDAISDLASAPTNPNGDTIKALAGGMTGLWRYRIGDYRIVYKPDATNRCVTLLAFAARGEI